VPEEIGPVTNVPLAALAPDHAPPAAHDVAFVADQDKVVLLPATTVLGDAVKETVGEGAVTETVADCDAVPDEP
jgi:hypothetical protein